MAAAVMAAVVMGTGASKSFAVFVIMLAAVTAQRGRAGICGVGIFGALGTTGDRDAKRADERKLK